jgi:hypothetical protein
MLIFQQQQSVHIRLMVSPIISLVELFAHPTWQTTFSLLENNQDYQFLAPYTLLNIGENEDRVRLKKDCSCNKIISASAMGQQKPSILKIKIVWIEFSSSMAALIIRAK